MKQACIFYFSGTGNTWWVSNQLAAQLREQGIETSVFSIEKVPYDQADRLIDSRDIVGFGYPVYGSDVPYIMRQYLLQLSPGDNKLAFVFCTQWMFSGDGARAGGALLEESYSRKETR